MDILNVLKDQLGDSSVLKQLADSAGADSKQVSSLTQLGIPAILESLTRNVKSKEGAESLSKALDNHSSGGVSKLDQFLKNVDIKDGEKILSHIFGDNKDKVQKNLAKKTGLAGNQVSEIMSKLAPVIMETLGSHKKENKLDTKGVSGILPSIGEMLGLGNLSGITDLLDKDGDGDIMDDVKGMVGKFLKK